MQAILALQGKWMEIDLAILSLSCDFLELR